MADLVAGAGGASMDGAGRGRGRGWYYKQKYGRGGAGRFNSQEGPDAREEDGSTLAPESSAAARSRGSVADLSAALRRLEGKSYGAYHDIEGAWSFPGFTFILDRAQSDPYAAPSRCRVKILAEVAAFPSELYRDRTRAIALCDILTRSFGAAVSSAGADVRTEGGGWKGNKGGEMTVDAPGQHVLERTSCSISSQGDLEARFTVALPARGRTVLGNWAAQILVSNLPRYVNAGLLWSTQDKAAVQRHVECVEDTHWLRSALPGLGLVAFVGNGSVLPRQSGASDAPMASRDAVPFQAPPNLAVEVDLPNGGRVKGLGIRKGVTLIVGGGFNGKSTLLQAIEAGVYDKVPGDGRELVVAVPDAVTVRAEDGRRVEATDISPFISNLPFGKDTSSFSSPDASGSTSQAANIQEALELGASCLILDEDVCATNFMIRDARMQALVAREKEPITPFLAKIGALRRKGVSCILVMGGSGDYFGVSDTVLCMDSYACKDVTQEALAIDQRFGSSVASQDGYGTVTPRCPVSIHPGSSRERLKVNARQTNLIQYGDEEIDLSAVEQLVEKSQTRAIADAISVLQSWLGQHHNQGKTLRQLLQQLETDMDSKGLDVLAPSMHAGNLARPRLFEIGAAVNRLRSVKMRQQR
ncbi:g3603 [Coccomyxa viridis]|uniref:G3603 protein n=1 Tax=Coccomyxa viridis TaxID=1274662 RepID=A0ABP1FV37_9CHLO